MENKGAVYLVGAGPGDPGLMTLKGKNLLASCDAVVYDHLASEHFLGWVSQSCKKIYVGKQSGRHSMKQEEINDILVELARSGLKVVRLKGGDPFVFGRGGEEILALEARDIPYETVPGVTSAVAVPESAGIPVTHRAVSRSFHVITGHTREGGDCPPSGFQVYAALTGTLVFLMGLGQLPAIAKGLVEGGKSPRTPAAVIEKGTLPGQRTVRGTLGDICEKARKAGIGTPAVIVVGETAAYEMKCAQTAAALAGVRVGVTGTGHFAGRLAGALEKEGAETFRVLDMEVISHAAQAPMQEAYQNLSGYSWAVFTSANGVRLFFEGLRQAGMDHRALGHLKFAVIGDGTGRELDAYGFKADYTPDSFCAEALASGLGEILTEADRLLIARSAGGSPVLTEILRTTGAAFDDIVLYQVAGKPVEAGIREPATLDYLVFASASGVRAFLESGMPLAPEHGEPGAKLVCIGGVTARELEKHGMKADIIADKYHIQGLVRAIIEDAISSKRS